MTSRILDVSHALILPSEASDDLLWMNILKALSAYQMYRRHVSVHADSSQVIDFLLKDRYFPRTVTYCLNEIARILAELPKPESVFCAVSTAIATIDSADGEALAKSGLHEFVDRIQAQMIAIDDALKSRYFSLSHPAEASGTTTQ